MPGCVAVRNHLIRPPFRGTDLRVQIFADSRVIGDREIPLNGKKTVEIQPDPVFF